MGQGHGPGVKGPWCVLRTGGPEDGAAGEQQLTSLWVEDQARHIPRPIRVAALGGVAPFEGRHVEGH